MKHRLSVILVLTTLLGGLIVSPSHSDASLYDDLDTAAQEARAKLEEVQSESVSDLNSVGLSVLSHLPFWNAKRIVSPDTLPLNTSIASLRGRFGVVWATDSEIYFLLVNQNGKKIRKIQLSSGGSSQAPVIMSNGDEFVVVWEQGCHLMMARVTRNGKRLRQPLSITYDDYGECPTQADITWDGANYAVAWAENRAGTEGPQIFFKKLDAHGNAVTEDIKLTQAIGSRENPSIVWTGSDYGIAWSDFRDSAYNTPEIYFMNVDINGAPTDSEKRITYTPDISSDPDLHWNGMGYDLFWTDYDNATRQIYFAKLDGSGERITGDIPLTSNSADQYSTNSRAIWGKGYYGLVWWQDGTDIMFARISRFGHVIGPTMSLWREGSETSPAEPPAIAWSGEQFGAVWTTQGDGAFFASGL